MEHAPFAFWLVGALHPRRIVELGTHGGFSYFVFCQAVQRLGLDSRCYAVDTWKGDEHAGFYGEEVYQQVRSHNDRLYSGLSTLIRSTFDEALAHFSDGTIDLLHVDGRHFLADVKHDFESWLPKLSNRSVVLFHDTNVRERGFGVFKLWEHLCRVYPHFEFLHGYGLGVLGVGGDLPELVLDLLAAGKNEDAATHIRNAYSRLGSTFSLQFSAQQQGAEGEKLKGDIAPGHAEAEGLRAELAQTKSEGEQLRAELAHTNSEGERLRVELAQTKSEGEQLRAESARAKSEDEQLRVELARAKVEGASLDQELGQKKAESDALRSEVRRLAEERDQREAALLKKSAENEHLRAAHYATLASISWRITEPLRWIRRRFPATAQCGRAMLRIAWRGATFQLVHRRHLRANALPTRAFTYWKERGTLALVRKASEVIQRSVRQQLERGSSPSDDVPRPSTPPRAHDAYREMLSRSERKYKSPDYCSEVSSFDFDLSQSRVKLFAFYLPQFHPIPENDLWWGKGFTEWTNVTRALPQFEGHDQPRLPSDLGFYDLRNEAILEQQVALAKKYGIEGFCFHFYWFAGKRLLERPLDTFLRRRDLDLKFCLCWANENWTRRWDGQEEEILIGQQHSPDDDFQVMTEMCKYIDDPRYLTVGGRPVVIVYRVQLLPTPKETAERWRRVVKERLGKDVFLVYAMTFGNTSNPARFGFDASVPFPPHSIEPVDITSQVTLWNAEFSGKIYDYEALVPHAASQLYSYRFPLFPTVFPGWDNTPRRGSSSSVFAGANPDLYAAWLSEAVLFANDKQVDGESIVFINSWNEWAEGAFLEPDQKYGHACLRATAEVLRPYCKLAKAPLELHQSRGADVDQRNALKPAIIIHAFYPEILVELLGRVPDIRDQALYISVPEDRQLEFENIMIGCAPDAALFPVPNWGRDVRPFLSLLRHAQKKGHTTFIKLHTKKSSHRSDGAAWRATLAEPLFRLCERGKLGALLREHPKLGLATTRGQMLDGMSYIGGAGNIAWLRQLCAAANIAGVPEQFVFPGGNMFAGRIDALYQLLCPEIGDLAFEGEQGRVDGTLAHAFERFFGILTRANGFEVVGIEVLDDGRFSVSYNEKCTKGYQFAQRTSETLIGRTTQQSFR